MIELNGITPFAEGGNRICFIHPNNPDRCLKVIHKGLLKKIKKNKPWYKKFRSLESFDDNLRERDGYNQKALKKNDPEVWKHLAIWYGMKETSIGMASETELIKNGDEIAETLESYLSKNGLTIEIKNAIKDFQSWLRKHLVLTKNLLPHNLVLKKEDNKIAGCVIDVLFNCSSEPLEIISIKSKPNESRIISLYESR